MLRSLLYLILSVTPVVGEEQPGLSIMEILRQEEVAIPDKMKALGTANPKDELRRASMRGDHRFIDLTGFGAVPGVGNWNLKLEEKYGTMVVGSGWSMTFDDDEQDYEKALAAYATLYNQLLFAQLGEKPDPVEKVDVLPLDKKIDVLIARLALSDREAKDFEFTPTPSRDELPSDRRMIAFDAMRQLIGIGDSAFPKLIARLDDRRQSIGVSRRKRHDVGVTCLEILREQIYSFPEDFSTYGFYRKGADGQNHENPFYSDHDFFNGDLGAWLTARKESPLLEIQIEVLTWALGRERSIGASTPEDKQSYIVSLEKHLEKLKERRGIKPE